MKINKIDEINNFSDLYLVLEGDWGGQIYLTIPLKKVEIDTKQIIEILYYLDSIAWPSNDNQGNKYYIEETKKNIPGGMGGGRIMNEIWLHSEFTDKTVIKVKKMFKIN